VIVPRTLAKLSLDPKLAPILACFQKIALQHMLLLSGFSAQDADRIASEQNWQIAFDELSKLVVQRFRPELEDFLPEGMRWEQVEKSLATVGQVDSVSEFVAKVKSPEEFARDCLVQIALLAIKEVAKTHEVQPNILESVFQTFDREQLIEVMTNPTMFFESFQKEGGALAMNMIVHTLRSQVADKMPDGMTWEEVEASLKEMSLERLREGLSDPATFWRRLVESFGPLAIKLALEKAKPIVITQMPGTMSWLDAKNVLVDYCSEAFASVEGLKFALQSLADDEQVQKRFILALARASLEKHLPTEVVWSDVERFAEKVGPKDLRAAVADPAGQGPRWPLQIHPVDCDLI
jgi:DNA-binding transcriptional regulator YhcF (GntR family)